MFIESFPCGFCPFEVLSVFYRQTVTILLEKIIIPAFVLLLCGLLATMPAVGLAQETAGSESSAVIEEVMVTGTRRQDRVVTESVSPIDVLSSSDLQSTGYTETNRILSDLLPSFNFPLPSITDGTDHIRPATLRGLAPDHVLVLVNGKRRHTTALLNINGSVGRGSSAVDMNTIPAGIIQRVEVLRDGAAAQYGSDAIAGVINLVLRQSPGGSFNVTYGQYVTELDGVPEVDSVSVVTDGAGNESLMIVTGDNITREDGETVTIDANYGFSFADNGYLQVAAQLRDQCDAFADERALCYAAAAGLILEGQDWQPGQGFAVEIAGQWTRSGHPFAFDVGADEIAEAMRGAVPRSQQGDSQ